jgi:hypothetical protein
MAVEPKKPASPMPGAFAKLAGAFFVAGAVASIATASFVPLVVFIVALYPCLVAANAIEKSYPDGSHTRPK